MVWLEVLTTGYLWDEARDVERFREAFRRYAGSARGVWPQPADIVSLLPRAEEPRALPASSSDSAKIQSHIDDLAAFLGVNRRAH